MNSKAIALNYYQHLKKKKRRKKKHFSGRVLFNFPTLGPVNGHMAVERQRGSSPHTHAHIYIHIQGAVGWIADLDT